MNFKGILDDKTFILGALVFIRQLLVRIQTSNSGKKNNARLVQMLNPIYQFGADHLMQFGICSRGQDILYSENVNQADISEETIRVIVKEKKRFFSSAKYCVPIRECYQRPSSSTKVTSMHLFCWPGIFQTQLVLKCCFPRVVTHQRI